MDFLSDIPVYLLIAVGLAIVNGIKYILEKFQGGKSQDFDWPEQNQEPDWFDPETYEQADSPPPVTQERRPPRRDVSVPPPVEVQANPIPVASARSQAPAWGTSGAAATEKFLQSKVKKPKLSRAEQEALDRLQNRKSRKRRRSSSGTSVFEQSERDFLRTQLRHPRSARHAIVLTEVLAPPLALRE